MEKRLTRRDVKALYNITSDSTLWRWVEAGKFPGPIRVNSRSVYWTREQLEQWEASRRSADAQS